MGHASARITCVSFHVGYCYLLAGPPKQFAQHLIAETAIMFEAIVAYLSKKGESILWLAFLVFLLEAGCLALAQNGATLSSRLSYGFSKSAGLLMTVDSP